jgi:hypothetical protein
VVTEARQHIPSHSWRAWVKDKVRARENTKLSRVHVLRYAVAGLGKPRSAKLTHVGVAARHGRATSRVRALDRLKKKSITMIVLGADSKA